MANLWHLSALFRLAPAVSRSQLRWELINIAVAVALLSVALTAIALFFFRRGARDLTLIYFSLLLILYATLSRTSPSGEISPPTLRRKTTRLS